MLKGFKEFILRGNVVDLAVGVIIGAAFNSVVQSFVKGLLTPFIGLFGGQPNFSDFVITINKSEFLLGDFLNAFISFLINAAVIYFFVIVPMNRLTRKTKKQEIASPITKECPFCYSIISSKATRCPQCTSDLKNKK